MNNVPDASVEDGMAVSSPSGCSMVISLDDELEWQRESRTHSPRTPTSVDAFRTLSRVSPQQAMSSGNAILEGKKSITEQCESDSSEALMYMASNPLVRSALALGDKLCFDDGVSYPLDLLLPLQARVTDESEDSDQPQTTRVAQLTIGSVWLSVVAERTYENQLCILMRSRRNLQNIALNDRVFINRFILGKETLESLQRSRLWTGDSKSESVMDVDTIDYADDYLSIRAKHIRIFRSLEEEKASLEEEQTKLRRQLARELQRIHSVKQPTAIDTPISNGSAEPNAVANMLKRPNTPAELDDTASRDEPAPSKREEVQVLETRLKCLHVEWYRVSERLRSAIETQTVLERKLKRLRVIPTAQ
jgi:hypothetical protein